MTWTALYLVVAYLAGSVNSAILVLRAMGLADPRTVHSGNPGTTNVARVAGPFVAAIVLVLDLARAVAIELIAAAFLSKPTVPWAGLSLLLGNRYPVWHGFRGGKGVATYLGFVAVLSPLGAAFAAFTWVLIYALCRVPAVASMGMVACLGVAVCRAAPSASSLAATALSLLLILHGHRSNWRSLRTSAGPR